MEFPIQPQDVVECVGRNPYWWGALPMTQPFGLTKPRAARGLRRSWPTACATKYDGRMRFVGTRRLDEVGEGSRNA